MAEIPFVRQKHFDIARAMEEKLLDLPIESGLLFAGVSITPTVMKNDPIYRVWVGCSRNMDEGTVRQLVLMTLRDEMKRGAKIKDVYVHRGVIRVDSQQ